MGGYLAYAVIRSIIFSQSIDFSEREANDSSVFGILN